MKKKLIPLLALVATNTYAIHKGAPLDETKYPNIVRVFAYKDKTINDINSYFWKCTGTIVSDHIVLTAGHCMPNKEQLKDYSLSIIRYNEKGQLERFNTKKFYSHYDPDTPDSELTMYDQSHSSPGYVPGCYAPPVALPHTKATDIAAVILPKGTFKQWAQIDTAPVVTNDEVSFYGYGLKTNSFTGSIFEGSTDITDHDLSRGDAHVWERENEQRISFVTKESGHFADSGDSGGPVMRDGKLVAVLSTVDQKCETPYGSDYAIVNTATRITEIIKDIDADPKLNENFEQFLFQ